MERFSTRGKSPFGSRTTEDKIKSIAEHAATVSSDWLKVKIRQYWDLSKSDQIKLIEKNINKFFEWYEEDIQAIIEDDDYKKFIKSNKDDIIKNVRKFMTSIYSE